MKVKIISRDTGVTTTFENVSATRVSDGVLYLTRYKERINFPLSGLVLWKEID